MKLKFPLSPLFWRAAAGPPRRHEQRLAGVTLADGRGRAEWVLSRPLYRFARFDLKAVPPRDRGRALEVQVRQWLPFSRSGSYLLWEGDSALVWAWDADRVEGAMGEAAVDLRRTRIVPETLLRDRRADGAHLVASLEGFEGQIWRSGSLTASRWWAAAPAAGDWLNFQKDAGLPPAEQLTAPPPALTQPLAARPWGPSEALDRSWRQDRLRESWAVSIAAAALLWATLFYGAGLAKVKLAIGERTARLDRVEDAAAPVLAARVQALDALERVRALQNALDRQPDAIVLMAKVAEALAQDGSHLRSWELMGGTLKLQVVAPRPIAASDWIRRFEALRAFRNVQASPGTEPNHVVLSLEALPAAEMQLASAGAPR